MNLLQLPRLLNAIAPADDRSDRELLREFVNGSRDAAFAEMVRRHSRLVWTVCRQISECDADADDAFQATFVVLLQHAKSIREPERLSAWLHGVACRIVRKVHTSRVRRVRRERASARGDGDAAVPDSLWDRTLAAVHEELLALPDSQRVPFILCCLEGRSVTDSARQLGWKLGTFSARLTRAKDALLKRLAARGLPLGAVAGLGLMVPSSACVASAMSLTSRAIPSALLPLSNGVLEMGLSSSVKLLAAGILVACGLSAGVGSGWLASAGAQNPPATASSARPTSQPQPPKTDEPGKNAAKSQEMLAEYRRFLAAETLLEAARAQKGETATFSTSKWDYDLVIVSDMTQTQFAKFLEDRERRGWEYNGTTPMVHEGKSQPVWVFRRPMGTVHQTRDLRSATSAPNDWLTQLQKVQDVQPDEMRTPSPKNTGPDAARRKEIRKLEKQIAELKGQVLFYKDELPIDTSAFANLLRSLVESKFKNPSWQIHTRDDHFAFEANQEIRTWAVELAKKLSEK